MILVQKFMQLFIYSWREKTNPQNYFARNQICKKNVSTHSPEKGCVMFKKKNPTILKKQVINYNKVFVIVWRKYFSLHGISICHCLEEVLGIV